jgi:LysM repeat protein
MQSVYTKSLMISLGLILALVFTMAGFVTPAHAQSPCGSTYTVRSGDTLFSIAQRCETTVDALLDENPAITNRNMIRTGQVLQIPTTTPDPPDNGDPGDPQLLLVPNSGPAGVNIEVRISGFPANEEVSLALGVEGEPPLDPVMATTDDQGRLQTDMTIPTTAQLGERWVVTASVDDIETTSNVFLVGTGDEMVAITPTSGPAESEINVEASGFLPNVTVLVGIGRQGAEPVMTWEADTDAQGNVSTTITVPETAPPTTNWTVVVATQGWRITALSEIFTVTGDPVDEPDDPENDYIVHTVQRGEWLHRIARQYNVTASEILAINPDITNANQISVGQQIRIPTTDDITTTTVNVYLYALGDAGERGPEFGCSDSIVPIEVEIEETEAPLRATLERLFITDGDPYNLNNVFLRSGLTVEGINIVDREAIIELSGDLSIGGVCDHPRIVEQLERTALQFDTIDSVSVSVNNEPLSEILDLR